MKIDKYVAEWLAAKTEADRTAVNASWALQREPLTESLKGLNLSSCTLYPLTATLGPYLTRRVLVNGVTCSPPLTTEPACHSAFFYPNTCIEGLVARGNWTGLKWQKQASKIGIYDNEADAKQFARALFAWR